MHNPTQRTNFEVRVAAKEAKAALHGLTGVFMRLMEDHGRIAGLIQRALTAPDDEARVLLYLTIRSELVAHERGEHSVVYPALALYPETASIAAMHRVDAREVASTITELDALSVDSPDWIPTFERLARLVKAHVVREESDFFPKAQKALGKERAEELLYDFAAATKG